MNTEIHIGAYNQNLTKMHLEKFHESTVLYFKYWLNFFVNILNQNVVNQKSHSFNIKQQWDI